MQSARRILVFQTAFTGDVILTLPMIQRLKRHIPDSLVDVVATPSGTAVLANHPAVHQAITYDKKGIERGFAQALRLRQHLSRTRYDIALIPHRSIRSAGLCFGARIPRRIGFSTSAGNFLLTDAVQYEKSSHEIIRNLSLLKPLSIPAEALELPSLYPSHEDTETVDRLLERQRTQRDDNLVALAPGSVWATKRWLPDRFQELARLLVEENFVVVIIGGADDLPLSRQITATLPAARAINATGKLTVLQSADLIRRCKVAVCNDSSPMHLAVAMRTPAVAIFGATVPEFGFAPVGPRDQVVQTHGLACRPCAIHGGDRCPIITFDCMKHITVEHVLDRIHHVLSTEKAVV